MASLSMPEIPYSTTFTYEIRIDKEADIVEVRQRVRELAKACGAAWLKTEGGRA